MILGSAGCAAPRPTCPPTAIVGAPTPPSASPACAANADLGWLDEATELRIDAISHGHFGYSQVQVSLRRQDEGFMGTLVAAYRKRPNDMPRSTARPLHVDAFVVKELLAALRDAARAPASPPDAREVVVGDMSRTDVLVIDAMMRATKHAERNRSRHAQLFVDEGQDDPQRWRLHGCPDALPRAGQVIATKAFATFVQRLGVGAVEERLRKDAEGER